MSTPTKARIPAGDRGTADRIEASDGAYWVRLVTRQALDREGRAMDHCVGDGCYDILVGGEEICDDSIWSLRNADGVSILTVRVQDGELDYARGYSNNGPGRGASQQVSYLAKAFAVAGRRLTVDEDTGIVLVDDGRSFRRDRLPPEIVAAREAAERARMAERAERRRREREQGAGATTVYEIPFARIMFRPAGGARWERLGDVEPFEIRTDERPDRPLVDPAILHAPVHPAILLTAQEDDPIVEVWMLPHGRGQSCRTRSDIRFAVPASDILRAPLGAQNQVFLEAYRAAIAGARQDQDRLVEQAAGYARTLLGVDREIVALPWSLDPIPATIAIGRPREETPPPPSGAQSFFQTARGAVAITGALARMGAVITARAEWRPA